MNQNRKAQIFKNENWIDVEFQELKNGDNFRLFEFNGEEVKDKNGNTKFIATSDAYLNNGFWTINYNEKLQFSKELIKEQKPLNEGFIKKGGWNKVSTIPRPNGTPSASKLIKKQENIDV